MKGGAEETHGHSLCGNILLALLVLQSNEVLDVPSVRDLVRCSCGRRTNLANEMTDPSSVVILQRVAEVTS